MISASGGNVALGKAIRDLGFTWNKSESNRKFSSKRMDNIRAEKLAHLKNVSRYKNFGALHQRKLQSQLTHKGRCLG
jgi:hypothetical protein